MWHCVFLICACLIVTLPSCDRHDPPADITEVRRLVLDENPPDMDTSTVRVVLVHPEVAVAVNERMVVRPAGDTLRLPQMWVYVFEQGRCQQRINN